MKNILLTGIDGYVGWPTALALSQEFPQARIIGVDNLVRRRWVEEVGSVSGVPIATMEERLESAGRHGFNNLSFVQGDLTDKEFVLQLFAVYRFDAVLHLACQPSAPYSQINGTLANFTQFNNNQATRNLLWAIKDTGLAKSCHFIETTTMGVYGTPEFEIPEGFVTAENKGRRDRVPFSGMAGSWYHMSKCNDVNNMWLANRQWGLSISDLRMAIVYGTDTKETEIDPRLATRFDFDFYFGVVLNRFCAMAMTGYPIIIYGKGEQRKPQISLEDCVQSNVKALRMPLTGEFQVYNQATEVISIVDIAQAIVSAAREIDLAAELTHIKNPRVEKEEHKMLVDTTNFSKLLPNSKYTVATGIGQILKALLPYRTTLENYKDRFLSM